MQTLSSASRTCMASASAVECTATVAMPSSLHARRMRKAISPRLAIRILSNIVTASSVILRSKLLRASKGDGLSANSKSSFEARALALAPQDDGVLLFDNHQRLAEFDRLAVLDENLRHGARARGWNLVHRLHRLDDQKRLSDGHLGADLDERLGARLRRPISGANHRRGHYARMFCHVGDIGRRRHDRCREGGLNIRRQRCRDRDVARNPHPQSRALDLDLGEIGLVKQQGEFADQRAVVALGFCGGLVVRLARHDLDPELSKRGDGRLRQAFALTPILAARPEIASLYPSMPKPESVAKAALAVKE